MLITLDLPGGAQAAIDKIKTVVNSNNGEFNGDENSGSIKIKTPIGEVSANYKITGNQISIDEIKKPLFITEAMIREELLKYI
jgi:hypothetical protein